MNSAYDTTPGGLDSRAEAKARRAIRFDGTINMGHILTFAAGLTAGAAAWNGIDKRVTILEEARNVQTRRDDTQDVLVREQIAAMNALLTKIDQRVERLGDRLGDRLNERASAGPRR